MPYTDTHTHATAISGLVETETTTYLRTTCDSNINVITNQFIVYTDAETPSEFDPSWAFSDASEMTVDYGDGYSNTHATTGYRLYAAGSGRKRVVFTCPNWSKLTSFNIGNDVCALGFPAFLDNCANLTYLVFSTNNFVGPLPSFARCTKLEQVHGVYNPLSGDMPDFSPCTAITTFLVHGAYGMGAGMTGSMFDISSWTSLAALDVSSNRLTGSIPSFAAAGTNLTLLEMGTNLFTGTLPSFSANTNLSTLSIQYNDMTGTIPDMSMLVNLTICELGGGVYTGYTSGSFATQKNMSVLKLQYNSFSAATVNAVLADLVASLGGGRVACTVGLYGTGMSAPTGQGATDKATLIAAGWTVTTV